MGEPATLTDAILTVGFLGWCIWLAAREPYVQRAVARLLRTFGR